MFWCGDICECVWIYSETPDIQDILGSGEMGFVISSLTVILALTVPQVGAILNATSWWEWEGEGMKRKGGSGAANIK